MVKIWHKGLNKQFLKLIRLNLEVPKKIKLKNDFFGKLKS